jgi:hypothetical protein
MLFMQTLGKLLFPRLPPDQRRKRIDTIMIVALVMLVFDEAVRAMIFLMNRH